MDLKKDIFGYEPSIVQISDMGKVKVSPLCVFRTYGILFSIFSTKFLSYAFTTLILYLLTSFSQYQVVVNLAKRKNLSSGDKLEALCPYQITGVKDQEVLNPFIFF